MNFHASMSSYQVPCKQPVRKNVLLRKNQLGFQKKRSTELATTVFFDKVKQGVDKNKMVGVVFIDLCKAFDTIGHIELITKLQQYGVEGPELEWFQDYLFGRTQVVQFGSALPSAEFVGPFAVYSLL